MTFDKLVQAALKTSDQKGCDMFYLLMISALIFGFALTLPGLKDWMRIVGMLTVPTALFSIDLSVIHDEFWQTEGWATMVLGWGTYYILMLLAIVFSSLIKSFFQKDGVEN